jgi:indolepyruvate ferredoxin oxidoreductase
MAAAALAQVSLDDKYALQSGRIFLSGTQALVRIPMMQRERDRAMGLDTRGFVSGYRGSPLGVLDNALWSAKAFLDQNDIRFQPGLNEELAATAVWGTQQIDLHDSATVDGVFAMWYGKGPGVDRSMDALKHANYAGTARHGGVLAVVGDDHACQSSTLPHQSEQMFEAALIPLLNPATVQDYLDFGLYGFALSRFSGCWAGLKAASETVECSASVHVDPGRIAIAEPADFESPPGGLNIRWPNPPLEQERSLFGPRMAAVAAFARTNPIDRLEIDTPVARLGILAAGKAYLDLRQALLSLGIDENRARALGIRLYKPGLVWPLETEGARRFATGLSEILVIEEKRAFLETQLTRALYNSDAARRPMVVGKADEAGRPLLASHGQLSPVSVAHALLSRLERLGAATQDMRDRLGRIEQAERRAAVPEIGTRRIAFFCSGCPHNTSTKLPDGSRGLAGTGCHGMIMDQPSRNTQTITQMGGEGTNWIGRAPFVREKHMFQNLGDGTFAHSGLMAIRAAAAAGVNITYKILFNDAVAMTGGQPAEGAFTVGQVVEQIAAERAKRIIVLSDEPEKYAGPLALPPGTEVRHRRDLDAVQRELRDIEGLTVLIYDQTCAAEKRRRRKRNEYPDPPKRVFINDAVCEACGDCSRTSNCISVQPLETEFGRKRVIDQSSCNKDFSCLDGFCPSFVTVHGAAPRKARAGAEASSAALFENLPAPALPRLAEPYSILITGIGGTGVITIGALLGMAAHLEGKGCSVLDFHGVAQKNGAVASHVRLAARPEDLSAARVPAGGADLLLGCDMVVAVSPEALARYSEGATRGVVNTHVVPTSGFVMNPDVDLETKAMVRVLRRAIGENGLDLIDAGTMATRLMGDSIATNLFMLGYAFQQGLVPLSQSAIERAIELNGTAVAANKRTFAWGRLAAHDPKAIERVLGEGHQDPQAPRSLPEIIARRIEVLTAYQDADYAERYRLALDRVAAAEREKAPGRTALAEAAAHGLFKLMAYKDEYEVARLYVDGNFERKLKEQFEGDYSLRFHLAPPLWPGQRQKPRKIAFGPWMFGAFRVLARLKRLRGTPFDIFGFSAERRGERQLISDYEALLMRLAERLTPENHALAVELALLARDMRGFGHIKAENVAKAQARQGELLAAFEQGERPLAAAE